MSSNCNNSVMDEWIRDKLSLEKALCEEVSDIAYDKIICGMSLSLHILNPSHVCPHSFLMFDEAAEIPNPVHLHALSQTL